MNGLSCLVHHIEVAPPAGLREAIRCFWHERRDFGDAPAQFTILPDGYAEIVFYVGSVAGAASTGKPGDADMAPLPSPFIMGLLDRPVVLRVQGRVDVIGIRCFPWTVFDLLGLPSGTDRIRVFEHPIARLQPLLAGCLHADQGAEALALVRDWFMQRPVAHAVDSRLGKAGAALRQAGGALPVAHVAAAAHASVRTLERKFRQSSGHTVKDVASLMRFERVRNRLWQDPEASIAGLAQEFGYTDQAHLSRDFKRYSGTTPAAFARKARQDQDAVDAHPGADLVAFVQA